MAISQVWDQLTTPDRLLLAVVLGPAFLALVAYALGKAWRPMRDALTLFALGGDVFLGFWLLRLQQYGSANLRLASVAIPGATLEFSLFLDQLGAAFLFLVGLGSLGLGLFCLEKASLTLSEGLILFLLLTLSAANGMLSSGDLYTLYLFSWCFSLAVLGAAISIRSEAAADAAKKALWTVEGAGVLWFAALLAAPAFGLDGRIVSTAQQIALGNTPVLRLLGVSLIVPFAARAAVFPLHGWLTGLVRAMGPGIGYWTAVLASGSGFYLLIRFFSPAVLEWGRVGMMLEVLGALALVAGAIGAYRQLAIRPLLAYLVLAQVGSVTLALGFGTELGKTAALYQLASQFFYLGLLMASVEATMVGAHSQTIDGLREAAGETPLAALGVVWGGLSAMAVPASAGYGPRYLLLEGLISARGQEHQAILAVVFLANALLVVPILRLIGSSLDGLSSPQSMPFVLKGVNVSLAFLGLASVSLAVLPALLLQGVLQPLVAIELGTAPGFLYAEDSAPLAAAALLVQLATLGLGIWIYRRSPEPALAGGVGGTAVVTLVATGPQPAPGVPMLARAYDWVEEGRIDLMDTLAWLVTLTARICAFVNRNTLGRLTR